ncbi:MAG: 23S rRNA (pseudouridine(1915)-N(3))-methyltransferase RlmH, partial [Christensenellaceae bacterium]
IRPDERVIALAIEGKQPDTIALSKKIRSSALSSQKLCFVIGGSLGLSPEVKARADELMSLSLLTLPHRLARIVLLEQIYRSLTIINNKTYHK